MPGQPVGRVAGTEDATPLQFWVALRAEAVPAARRRRGHRRAHGARRRPGRRPSGVVTAGPRPARGRQFGSDVFLIADGVLPAQVQEIAEVTTTRVEPEVYVPPRPGCGGPPGHGRASATRRCTSTRWTRKVPVGLGRDGAPIYVNLEFLDGTRGAHVSISGISGVATKTSFAMFLLHSIFQLRRARRAGASTPRR